MSCDIAKVDFINLFFVNTDPFHHHEESDEFDDDVIIADNNQSNGVTLNADSQDGGGRDSPPVGLYTYPTAEDGSTSPISTTSEYTNIMVAPPAGTHNYLE